MLVWTCTENGRTLNCILYEFGNKNERNRQQDEVREYGRIVG
jgi:hypothetical protein